MVIEVVLRLIGWRMVLAVPLLLAVVLLAFALIHLAPGNPAFILAGDSPTPKMLAKITAEYGLDKPMWRQLVSFLGHAAHGDLGSSIYYKRPAIQIIMERVPATLLLTVTAMVLSTIVGVLLGVYSAVRAGSRTDTTIGMVSLMGYSMPAFWLGQLLIMFFAVRLKLLPTLGMTSSRPVEPGMPHLLDLAGHLILPVLTLMPLLVTTIMRYTRTAMIGALGREYVVVARAKGISPQRVLWNHAFRNASVATVTIVGLEFGSVLAGVVVIEIVFAWPGLGRLFYDAIFRRDFPLMIAAFIFSSFVVIVVNGITDVICALIDPRLRT
ncbi:MAG: dppB [Bradyrhizobium sp.]|nr:dppB [Bradyrhizobium sp.]